MCHSDSEPFSMLAFTRNTQQNSSRAEIWHSALQEADEQVPLLRKFHMASWVIFLSISQMKV